MAIIHELPPTYRNGGVVPLTIVYHHPCLDGVAAAWAAWYWLHKQRKDIRLHPAKYGDAAPPCKDHDVLVVDFSYPRDELVAMAEVARSLTVLDHHATAQRHLEGIEQELRCRSEVVFDMDRAGCQLSWDHLSGYKARPPVLDHVADRDLWRFKLERTKEVCAALYSYELEVGEFNHLVHKPLNALVSEGLSLERQFNRDLEGMLRPERISTWEVLGYRVPVVNLPMKYASEAGHRLAPGYPFAVIYEQLRDGVKFSLRSSEDGVDVAQVAERFGGGGHPKAAGFFLTYQEQRMAVLHGNLKLDPDGDHRFASGLS